jgi:YegS/Rv2252/BmrU family lipid kinase
MALGRALLIVNPAAKHGETAKLLPRLERLAAPDIADLKIVLSAGPRHALDIAKTAAGFDAVIAVGGDGTAHEVLNGLMEHAADSRPLYGIVPTGSGNDYAHTLGMSDDPPTALLQLASAGQREVDLGRCNGVWFGESVAVGLDARVTAKAVELKTTTRLSGLALYLRALMYVLSKEYYGHEVTVQFDDNPPFATEMLILAATNGPTYGGGFRITPDSVVDDGLLDICRIDTMPKPEAFMRLPFVIAGKHTRMRPVHMTRARRVRIAAEKPVEGQIDGEVMLERSYDIEVVPKALRVLAPDRAGPEAGP